MGLPFFFLYWADTIHNTRNACLVDSLIFVNALKQTVFTNTWIILSLLGIAELFAKKTFLWILVRRFAVQEKRPVGLKRR